MTTKLITKIPNFPGKEKIIRTTSKAMLQVSKRSPEIFVGVGIASGIGATIFACKATLRVGEVMDNYNKTMENINFLKSEAEAGRPHDNYDVEEAKKEKFIATIQMLAKLGKLYAPAIALGTASIGFVLGGHHILAKRNAALSISYAALQKAYDEYRGRVREVVGEEKELDIFKGIRAIEIEEKNEKGKTVKKQTNELGSPASPYTRIFDESSCWWKPSAEQNKFFLMTTQAHCNDLLRLRGHIFLNEVFDMLDIPRCPMGAVCGWIYGEGDSFVDFGIWDATKEATRAFINGSERNIWLDFNCDGSIYDRI